MDGEGEEDEGHEGGEDQGGVGVQVGEDWDALGGLLVGVLRYGDNQGGG